MLWKGPSPSVLNRTTSYESACKSASQVTFACVYFTDHSATTLPGAAGAVGGPSRFEDADVWPKAFEAVSLYWYCELLVILVGVSVYGDVKGIWTGSGGVPEAETSPAKRCSVMLVVVVPEPCFQDRITAL
jgi:hypothetical protein